MEHFERALNALRIVWVDACRGSRVYPLEFGVQRLPPLSRGAFRNGGARRRIGGGQRRQTVAKRLEIEHRAADEDGHPAAIQGAPGRGIGTGEKVCGRKGLGGFAHVDQRMGMPRQNLGIRFGGADVHAPVDHRRIDADQVDVRALSKGKGGVGLADGRGPHDANGDAPFHVGLTTAQEQMVELTHALHVERGTPVIALPAVGCRLHLP